MHRSATSTTFSASPTAASPSIPMAVGGADAATMPAKCQAGKSKADAAGSTANPARSGSPPQPVAATAAARRSWSAPDGHYRYRVHIQGHCEAGYGRVADVFAARLESGRDIGGSVGVYLDGRPVVQIWGGSADPDRGLPWVGHTGNPIGFIGKALDSAEVLMLVCR